MTGRRGARLGVDVGSVRIGLAISDPDGILATPLETLPAGPGPDQRADPESEDAPDLDRLAAIVADHGVVEVIVGLPASLSGAEGAAAEAARAYAVRVARRVQPVVVRLVDERLSTVLAHQSLQAAGMRGRKRRRVVDQQAAVVILQGALDSERSTGRPPGSVVDPERDPEGPGRSRPTGGQAAGG